MITVDDLVTIPYSDDLTQAGITYACRSLSYTYDRMGGSKFERLRRIVAGIAVELAFRRRLTAEDVPFGNLGMTHFTQPDRYDVSLGGRRCDIKSYMIYRKDRIREIRRTPEVLLDAHALVPEDQFRGESFRDEDLYIFSFLTALVTRARREIQRPIAAGQPTFLLHPLPRRWARPEHWRALGPLAIKSDFDHPVELEIGGQDGARAFRVEQVLLPPRTRVEVETTFHAIHYFHAPELPDGRLGIHSPALEETYIAELHEWGNIWVYGMGIVLAGYMKCGEFRRTANRLPAGSRVLQYPRTRTDNMSVPMRQLHPLRDLFARAKNWSQNRP